MTQSLAKKIKAQFLYSGKDLTNIPSLPDGSYPDIIQSLSLTDDVAFFLKFSLIKPVVQTVFHHPY